MTNTLTFPLKEDRVAEYFATARERYEILLKRRAGQKAPGPYRKNK